MKGHRYYQYGSYPLLSDGRTWLVEYDFDDSQPWLDEYHHSIQKQLACVGFSSIYAKRRPGRGHLIVSFSSPVDPEAAHQTLLQVAPALGVCQEVYPVGSKRNEKISWPLYYVEDKKACECPMIAYFPGKLMEPVRCPGIRSDRGKVEYMFATAINDASLIQPLPPAPRKKPPLDMVSSNENIDREIEKRTFEACHTVTEALRMKVHDRFISPWRFPREDTPSAVVVSEHLVVDYGLENNPSGKPQYHGAWDCYVALKNGLIY